MADYKMIGRILNELCGPYVIDTDKEYYRDLHGRLKKLVDLLNALDVDDDIIHKAENFRNRLLKVSREYFKGNIVQAQSSMNSIIAEFVKSGDKSVSYIDKCSAFPDTETEIQFFRARLDAPEDGFSAKDMRHIPFTKRTKGSTERFSMPGFPCFYLGNTSYDCWLEMGMPADNRFHVSPVRLDGTQRVFNLAVSAYDIVDTNSDGTGIKYAQIKTGAEDLILFIHRIMLMIAASYRIREKDRNFKSEYIIPQLIMLSCKNQGLDGIVSYTVKVSNEVFSRVCGINVTLFAKYPGNRFDSTAEYSDIFDHIEMDDAFSFSMFKQINQMEPLDMFRLKVEDSPLIKSINYGSFEKQFDYRETEFYDFDKFLFYEWEKAKQRRKRWDDKKS